MPEPPPRAIPPDYDDDPDRMGLARSVLRRHAAVPDIHAQVAERFVAEGLLPVLDVGCGEGELARHLPSGGWMGVDRSLAMLARAPRPTIKGDATRLPFKDATYSGVAILYVLYHLDQPEKALAEARRVLRPGGLLAVAAPSRRDSPELAEALERAPLTFDAELAPEMVGALFDEVEVVPWDAPALRLPDRDAVRDYLIGKGLKRRRAQEAAAGREVPLTVTKRGALVYARRR